MNIENDLENKGVEIRVGAHIDANNETTLVNENVTTNHTSDPVVQEENSSFVINQTKTASEISSDFKVSDVVFEFEDLPIPAPLHQTTETLHTFNLGDTTTNIENKSMSQLDDGIDKPVAKLKNHLLIADPMTSNSTAIENQTDVAYQSDISSESIQSIVNLSNSNTSETAKGDTYHDHGNVITTEKISYSAHELTSETQSDFSGNEYTENESSAMYIDSDEINGITSDPHPRMLTEDLTDLVTTINDSISEFLANETQSFEKAYKNDTQKSKLPALHTLPTMTNASKVATFNASTFILNDETSVELLPDEDPYHVDSDDYILTTTKMSSYERLADENDSFSSQNISMSMDTNSEKIEVNKVSEPSHTTEEFQDDVYDDITLNDRIKGVDEDFEETTLGVESYESTSQLLEINLTEEEFIEISRYSTESFIPVSTAAPDPKYSLNGPESYYLSENYSSQNQFSKDQTTEKEISLISQLYNFAKEILTNQEKTNEMPRGDDRLEDPVSFYLNDIKTTEASSSENFVTEDEDTISTLSYKIGLETTTMQNEDYSIGLLNSLIVTEEYERGTESSSQNTFYLQSNQDDYSTTPKEEYNNPNILIIEKPNLDIAKSILLSKLFESSAGSENEEIDYMTTAYPSFDHYFQQDEVDSMASAENRLSFTESPEEFYVIVDTEQNTTTHPNPLDNSSTDQSQMTDYAIFELDKQSSKIYNNTIFSMNSSSSLTNTSKSNTTGKTFIGVDPIMNENSSMSKNLFETYLEDVDVINITTDVYIKSNYSYPNVEDQNYNFQSFRKLFKFRYFFFCCITFYIS